MCRFISKTKVFDLSENKNKLFDYLPEFIEDMRIGNIIPRDENLIVESFADLIKITSCI